MRGGWKTATSLEVQEREVRGHFHVFRLYRKGHFIIFFKNTKTKETLKLLSGDREKQDTNEQMRGKITLNKQRLKEKAVKTRGRRRGGGRRGGGGDAEGPAWG